MEAFPATLPKPTQALSLRQRANSIRTKMDAGNVRQRRRFTTEILQVEIRWEFTDAEMSLFISWHKQKINLGTDWFTLSLPLGTTGFQTHTVRFQDGDFNQDYVPVSNWEVSATLDVQQRVNVAVLP
jgi:hypothetical protein